MEECESNPLKDSHYQKGPKRGGQKIGDGCEGKKEGAGNHKISFRNF